MRTAVTVVALILYVLSFNFYLYELTHILTHRKATLLYNSITLSMLLFFILDLKLGFVSHLHEQLNLLCFLSVIANILLIICTHLFLIREPLALFFIFNGSIFATTLMVAISMYRHGFFKN